MHISRRFSVFISMLFIGAVLFASINGMLSAPVVKTDSYKVYVAFVWHLHQPVLRTNLDSIDLCYEMIPKIYLNHTSVKATINLQGMLIDQLAEIRPSVLDLYRNLTDTGQIELLASGHYHPILPLLSGILREKQIAKDIATVEKYFNVTPKGIWFPECGFSMDLIPLLNNFSLEYGVIEQEGLTGVTGVRQIQPHNITYGGGFTVFPRDHPISGTVAFGSTNPEQRATDVISQILTRNQSLVSAGLNNSIIVVAGDGEVVGEHWLGGIQFLESLLTKLEQVTNNTNLKTITLGEYYDAYGPHGTLSYIPPSTWAANPPRNFDWWNSTIVDLHSQDRDNHAMNEIIEAEGLGENLTTAWEHLMKSEESGMRYQGLGNLEASSGQRGMIYTHIIMAEGEAEQFTDGLNITEAPSRAKAYQKVVILENEYLKIYVAPYRGGRIIELDSKATNSNLVNTYQYSSTVSQDYRNALTDGIYEISPIALAFKRYDYEISSTANSVSLKLNYTIISGSYSGLRIQKTLTLRSNSPNLEIYLNLTNTAEGNLTFHFTSEWCLTPGGYLDGEDKINFREGGDVWQTTGMQPEDIYGEFPWVEVEDQDLTHWWEAQRSNKQEYALIRLDGQANQLHVETPQDTFPGNIIKLTYKATTLKPGESHTIMQNFTTGLGNHTVFDPTPVKRRGAVTTVELDGDLSDWSALNYVSLYDPEDNTDAVTDILNVTITNDAYYLYIGLILRGNIEATLGNDNRSIGIATSGGSQASGKPPLTYTMWPNITIGTDKLGFGARLSFPWWNKGRQNICRWFSTTSGWWTGGFDRNYGDMGYQLIGMKNNTMEIAIPLYDDGLMCKSTYETLNLTISAARGVSGAPSTEWFDLDVVPKQPSNITYHLLPFVAAGMNVTPTAVDYSIKRGESNLTTIQIKETTGKADINVTIAKKGEISPWLTLEHSQAIVPANTTLNNSISIDVPINTYGGKYYGAIVVSEEKGAYLQMPFSITVQPKMTVQTPFPNINVTVDGTNLKTDADGKVILEIPYGSHTIYVPPIPAGIGSRTAFSKWSDGDTSNPRNIAVTFDMLLIANFKTQHYLTVNSAFGSPIGEGWYDSGTLANFSVASLVDYGNGTRHMFTYWSGDLYTTTPNAGILIDAPHNVSANWKTQYRLQVNTTVSGLTISGSDWYDIGATALTGTAPLIVNGITGTRYVFVTWAVDGANQTGNPMSIPMNAPHVANAIYKTQHYLTIISGYPLYGGNVSGWYDAGIIVSTGTAQLTVDGTAGARYVFITWEVDGITQAVNPVVIAMNAPHAASAIYQTQYYLTIICDYPLTGGNVSGWYDDGAMISTGTAQLTVNGTAGTRYVFVTWAVDGANQTGNPLSISMVTPHTARAIYKTQYYLTVNSHYGDPQGEGWYDSGSRAIFYVASPISDGIWIRYVFERWSGDSTASTPTATILMDGPKNVTANWRSEYTQIFYIIVEGVAAVGVGLVIAIIFLLIRRKKP